LELPRPLITVDQLAALVESEPVVIADCRFVLANPSAGRTLYQEAHLPGAVYFHLDEDLSGPVGVHGGRHPLPDPAILAAKLGAAGVGPGVKVVAYDDSGPFAARFWWLLRWLGHDEVAVLQGGYSAWVQAGRPVTGAPPQPVARTFTPHPRPEMVAEMEAVRSRPASVIVVDARSGPRFSGQPDPLDPKPGHIPGAINRFWMEGLREGAWWLGPEEQRARFAGLAPDQVIHSCGSGVTACANLLAMEIAGLSGARLYPGSWSDWCTYEENPVET
jgi:thiosulfate/3-mercaptopyruvate sulfurtransferase